MECFYPRRSNKAMKIGNRSNQAGTFNYDIERGT
jgi:hypothetical protein